MLRVGREKKDYDQVWLHLMKACEQFGMAASLLTECFSISDEGSNVTKALNVYNGKSIYIFCI